MKKSKILSIITVILIMIFILSLSIALPIVFRPFYYLHISLLRIPETTGYSIPVIKEAYNCMLDYCMGLTEVFSCGSLAYSASGAAHFADVRGLFILDFSLFFISGALLVLILLLRKKQIIAPARLADHSCNYYATVILIAAAMFVVLISLGNFDRTFTVFHQIFFPGRDNWMFDPHTDPIILILPEAFFRNCAIAIVVNLVITRIIYLIRSDRNPL